MTGPEHQELAAADGRGRPEPVAAAASRAVPRPVATVAAAARQPSAQAATAAVTAAVTAVRERPEADTAPIPVQSAPPSGQAGTAGKTLPASSPPRERPVRREPLDLPVLRVVCWQLALVLVFLAIGRPWPVVIVLVPAAVALLGCTAVRVRGRWLSDELALRALLMLRRRERALPDADGARILLRTLAPGASVRTATLAGTPSGVVSRAEELVAVLRPAGADAAALAEFALSGVLPGETTDTTDTTDTAEPAVRFQLVVHRGPQQTDQARAWLVVRALRDPVFADDAQLLVAVSNAVRKLHRRLKGRAVETLTALPEHELLATLAALTHTGPGRGAIREDRRYWRAGPIAQAGLRLSGLEPRSARVHLLHHALAAAPGAACTVSVTVPEYAAVVRVAATTEEAVDAAAGWLLRTPPPGIRLERMDNQHAAAVAASLPIGGNP